MYTSISFSLISAVFEEIFVNLFQRKREPYIYDITII